MLRFDSIGYDAIHRNHFIYDIPEGFGNYLLVLTTTPAVFYIDGQVSKYPAHTAILYPPGQKIWYGTSENVYGNHWMQFSTDDSFIRAFSQQGIPFSVADPEYCRNLFQMIKWESSEMIQMQLMHILFEKLQHSLSQETYYAHDYELLALRRRISANPEQDWNVEKMAKQLHMSVGYLQTIYKRKFQVSCMEDVISCRLQKAKDYLIYTTQSISEIAEFCGYRNTEHFCRQFRKNIGISPGKYRQKTERE